MRAGALLDTGPPCVQSFLAFFLPSPFGVVSAAAPSACAALVCGCNTTKGVGADIEKAGDSLKDSADKHGAD